MKFLELTRAYDGTMVAINTDHITHVEPSNTKLEYATAGAYVVSLNAEYAVIEPYEVIVKTLAGLLEE